MRIEEREEKGLNSVDIILTRPVIDYGLLTCKFVFVCSSGAFIGGALKSFQDQHGQSCINWTLFFDYFSGFHTTTINHQDHRQSTACIFSATGRSQFAQRCLAGPLCILLEFLSSGDHTNILQIAEGALSKDWWCARRKEEGHGAVPSSVNITSCISARIHSILRSSGNIERGRDCRPVEETERNGTRHEGWKSSANKKALSRVVEEGGEHHQHRIGNR